MLINFNDLLFLSNKVNGIIHIGAHKLEELPDYLKGNVSCMRKNMLTIINLIFL